MKPSDAPDATVEFPVDDAYLEEYHGEWVATVGQGWRLGRRLTAGLLVLATLLLAAAAVARTPAVPLAGLACYGLAAANVVVRRREKARWLAIARDKLPFGRRLRLVVAGGRIHRDDPSADEEDAGATAGLLDTPKGYLLRLTMPAPPGSEAEPQATLLYVPRRSVQPPMDPAAFRALLE